MPSPTSSPTLKLVDSAVFRAIDDDETCLLDTDSKDLFSVNATGQAS